MKKHVGILVLCLIFTALFCCLTACSGNEKTLLDGTYIKVTKGSGNNSQANIHTEYKSNAVAAMKKGESLCESIEKQADHKGGSLTLSDGSKIDLDLSIQTASSNGSTSKKSESMYGMTAGTLKELGNTLQIDFLEPKNIEAAASENQYALTADPEFTSVEITSVAIPWEKYTISTEIDIYPKKNGSKITDQTGDKDIECLEMKSAEGRKADVLIQDAASAQIVLRSDGILYEYQLSSGDKDVIQSFLDSLS